MGVENGVEEWFLNDEVARVCLVEGANIFCRVGRPFLLLDHIGNCVIQLVNMNHEDCHFKLQNWSRDAKVINESKDSLSC